MIEEAIEQELHAAWRAAVAAHEADPTVETWLRRIAASAAWEVVYNWNRAE